LEKENRKYGINDSCHKTLKLPIIGYRNCSTERSTGKIQLKLSEHILLQAWKCGSIHAVLFESRDVIDYTLLTLQHATSTLISDCHKRQHEEGHYALILKSVLQQHKLGQRVCVTVDTLDSVGGVGYLNVIGGHWGAPFNLVGLNQIDLALFTIT
jgi:hypothetical protein